MNRPSPLHDLMTVRLGDDEVTMPIVSEIAPGIWQGGCPQNGLPLPERFKHVVNLFGVFEYRQHHVSETSVIVDMADDDRQDMGIVEPIARLVARLSQRGEVLVNCQAGLNRSGVVVARALMLRGMGAEEAIATVRERRHPRAIYNSRFTGWLHGQQ